MSQKDLALMQRTNLPQELAERPCWLSMYSQNPKRPRAKAWSDPAKQKPLTDVAGVAAMDVGGQGGRQAFAVFDFDHVLTAGGEFASIKAKEIFSFVTTSLGATYCESSLSGRGLHVVAVPDAGQQYIKGKTLPLGDAAEDGEKPPALELWYTDSAKLMTFTGKCYQCKPGQALAHGQNVNDLLAALVGMIDQATGKANAADERPAQCSANEPPAGAVATDGAEYDRARAAEMLKHIDPAGLNYVTWVNVGMALKNIGLTCADWDTWSATDSRYKAGECAKKWAGFSDGGRLGIATLHELAKAGGYDEKTCKREYCQQQREKQQSALPCFDKSAKVRPAQVTVNVAGAADVIAEQGSTKADAEDSTSGLTTADYLTEGYFQSDVAYFQAFTDRVTGFANLDLDNKLYPGLYVIGAISSLGKTTFVCQIASQLAQRGEYVLFFSYEQSKLELVSKSLSRLTAIADMASAVTSIQIRAGATGEAVKAAIAQYADYGQRETIYECGFDFTVDGIINTVLQAVRAGFSPIVIVDYLQVIAPSVDQNGRVMATKDSIDNTVKKLKMLQRQYGLVVFLVSSLNRQNYLTQIDYESFKESGGIEYTADVVWGLQLACMSDPDNEALFDKTGKTNAKRQIVADAKKECPRKIELACLKNRYGQTGLTYHFNYYPQYDYFVPYAQECQAGWRDNIDDIDLPLSADDVVV